MSARYRHWVGAVGADALPDTTVPALGDGTDHDAEIDGDDLANIAISDQIAGIHNRRIALRLQPDQVG